MDIAKWLIFYAAVLLLGLRKVHGLGEASTSPFSVCLEYPARVHEVFRIEGRFDPAHEIELDL